MDRNNCFQWHALRWFKNSTRQHFHNVSMNLQNAAKMPKELWQLFRELNCNTISKCYFSQWKHLGWSLSLWMTIKSVKGHDPHSHLQDAVRSPVVSYWLSEVRPPLDPGTDLSGTWGMRSWLAGEEMSRRGTHEAWIRGSSSSPSSLAPSPNLIGECTTITHPAMEQ